MVMQITGGTGIAAEGRRGAWIDCNQSTVPHFGLKGIFEMLSTHATLPSYFPMRIETTYYMCFKGVR